MNSIDIFRFNENSLSPYFPQLFFSNSEVVKAINKYIICEAEYFFENIVTNRHAKYLPYEKSISFSDFKKIEFKYFYENIFIDLLERDSDGKLIYSPKWTLTFDEEITSIEVVKPTSDAKGFYKPQCSTIDNARLNPFVGTYFSKVDNKLVRYSFRKYGYISLGELPILYYLHFTMQELIDEAKKKY